MVIPVHPNSRKLLLACRLVAVVWALMALAFVSWGAALALYAPHGRVSEVLVRVAAGSFVGLLAVMLIHLPLELTLRCPECGSWALLQTRRPLHPSASGGWSAVVVRVLRRREFRCMYCGRLHRVVDRNPEPARAPSA